MLHRECYRGVSLSRVTGRVTAKSICTRTSCNKHGDYRQTAEQEGSHYED